MRAIAVVVSLALGTSVFGQVQRSFGSVVFPGGTTSPSAGVIRNFGSTVFPGGAPVAPVWGGAPVVGARPVVGGITVANGNFLPIVNGKGSNIRRFPNNGINNFRGSRSSFNNSPSVYVYAYPAYVGGGGYDSSYGPNGYGPQDMMPPQPPPQQPNTTIVFPPQQQQPQPQPPTSVMIDVPQGDNAQGTDNPRFLLAFKDRTIYSVIAYWTDGDTLHYFTPGNVHNQVSMSLIDRELTERLNRELGIDFKLPAGK
jgi:hypothetical protein